MTNKLPPILQIGEILISSDILTAEFCCDLDVCKGACCVEGDAGAPITLDEVMLIEEQVDEVWDELSASAQATIDKQDVAYTDQEGDLVTNIVNGKDCVFTCYENGLCLCALERAARRKASGTSPFIKPISCALYPIREKTFSDGTIALNYHQWDVCRCAREKGKSLHLPVYQFLKEPLIRRFGEDWYKELCDVADDLHRQGFL